jgi:drug/metabolite transporter (DMT)-like permease
MKRPSLEFVAPWLFVLLWSTGFIGAKYGLPYVEPFTFLVLRWLIACALLFVISLAVRATYPKSPAAIAHVAISGLLIHAGYLGGVFYALDHGMPASLSSLIVGLQPILTAILAQVILREGVTSRQWFGLLVGFVGVALVVEEKVSASLDVPIEHRAFVAVAIGLLSTTAGTLYQKRFVPSGDLTASATLQYLTCAIVLTFVAFGFESRTIDWTGRFVFALMWQVVVLSVGAVLLLLGLIRAHSVSRISSLMYLVPPLTAIEAYFIFDERFGAVALLGMACVIAGVAMVMRKPATR